MLNDTQRQLVLDNLELVYSIAKKKKLLFDEDAVQYGFVGLCKAAENYDNSRGIKFSTYACSYITKWLDGLYSDIKYRKSIKEGKIKITDEAEQYVTDVAHISDEKILLSVIFSNVDDESKQIMRMIYEGYSNKEIYFKLNITSNRYYKKIKNIKEKFNYGRC